MKYYVFGVGTEVNECYNLEFLRNVDGFVDNDKTKQGKRFCGKEIQSFQDVMAGKDGDIFFIVSSLYAYPPIKCQLEKAGLEEGKNFVWGPYWYGNNDLPATYGFKSWGDYDDTIDFSSDPWSIRVRTASEMIDPDCRSLVDLGAGGMTIKKYLSKDVKYYPVDYCKRSDETIVCDLEEGPFPELKTDCALCLGILEYIKDVDGFIKNVCNMAETVIISYNPIDVRMNFIQRQHKGFRNHLTTTEVMKKFIANGFMPEDERMYLGGWGPIYKFKALP